MHSLSTLTTRINDSAHVAQRSFIASPFQSFATKGIQSPARTQTELLCILHIWKPHIRRIDNISRKSRSPSQRTLITSATKQYIPLAKMPKSKASKKSNLHNGQIDETVTLNAADQQFGKPKYKYEDFVETGVSALRCCKCRTDRSPQMEKCHCGHACKECRVVPNIH